jgi:deoxycytidylate deaminase
MNKEEINTYMHLALNTAKLSECAKRKVGAVALAKNGNIYSGWNQLPKNFKLRDCETFDTVLGKYITYPEVEHAERVLIASCAKYGVALEGATTFVTRGPCIECAKAICFSGIQEVYYLETPSKLDGLIFLASAGILIWKVRKNGDYFEITSSDL